ncbi:hypothetical protein MOQ_007743 [Trypanosoma cruzi marinkellei]|uniref:FHA domain-containing protein n=1 Tax=Trypanosoma cruzi marinkellei TaxID=85056 RepID=K2N1V5_TRYCR|nr:hypothetical protein MOQ_007743 [Trypanosoma cruzi marinkellei]
MFSLEFASGRPLGSAPYYSLVVREPYIVGRDRSSDIVLDHGDIVTQHASLTVMRESQAMEQQQKRVLRHGANANGDGVKESEDNSGEVAGSFLNDTREETSDVVSLGHPEMDERRDGRGEHDFEGNGEVREEEEETKREKRAELSPGQLQGNDPLVLRVVNLRDGGHILANEKEVVDHPVYLTDGAQLQFGAHIRLRIRFRPLLVSIARNAFSSNHVRELEFMYYRLGATLTGQDGPTPHLDMPQPISRLHCVEAINDDPLCLMALASGYSIVQPTYVFEWFAALAQSASSPLTVLPPPVRFEVPVQYRGATAAHAAFYLRPESDVCPFPLYPIPTTATRKRSRDALFKGKSFCFLTNAAENRYKEPVQICGGEVLHLEDIVAINKEAAEAAAKKATTTTTTTAEGGDAVNDDHEVDAAEDDDSIKKDKEGEESTEVMQYIVVDADTEAAMRRQEYHSLDGLRRLLDEIHRTGIAVPVISERSLFHALLTNRFTAFEVSLPTATDATQTGNQHPLNGETVAANIEYAGGESEVPTTATGLEARAINFLTDSTKGMLYPRQRGELHVRTLSPSMSRRREYVTDDLTKSQRRGRSGQSAPRPLPAVDLFEALRHRVRAFVLKEGSKLQENLAGSWRNLFVDPEVLDHAHACQSHSVRYLEKMEYLLPEIGEHPHIACDMRRCQRDCHEMLRTAQEIVELAKCASQRCQHPSRQRRMSANGTIVYPSAGLMGGWGPFHSSPSDAEKRLDTETREPSSLLRGGRPWMLQQGANSLTNTPRSSRGKGAKKYRAPPATDIRAAPTNDLASNQTDLSLPAHDAATPYGTESTPRPAPAFYLSRRLSNMISPSTIRAQNAAWRSPRPTSRPSQREPRQSTEKREELHGVSRDAATAQASLSKRNPVTPPTPRGVKSSKKIDVQMPPSARVPLSQEYSLPVRRVSHGMSPLQWQHLQRTPRPRHPRSARCGSPVLVTKSSGRRHHVRMEKS